MELLKDIWEIISTAELRNYLLHGFLNTLIISILASFFGLILGVLIALVKVFCQDNKKLKIPYTICNIYTTVIRGTPIALQMFIN